MLNTMAYDFLEVGDDLLPPQIERGKIFSLRASSIGPLWRRFFSWPPACSCIFKDLSELDRPFAKSRRLAGLTYACPMAYVVEDGTS